MLISKSKTFTDRFQHPALRDISPSSLRDVVEALAYPRHYDVNREANQRARDWIINELETLHFDANCQGEYDNIIGRSSRAKTEASILLGAHYDTVPGTPGADDNNSAIAVCLEAAKVLSMHANVPLTIAIFNREEDGLLGSIDYVQRLGPNIRDTIREAHIFEMVGYYTDAPNSQFKPANLPVPIPDEGNFVGVISNSSSNQIVSNLMNTASRVESSTPLLSLKVFLGIEKIFGDLLRSDHAPFWMANVPAFMWTDTSNFRNPHYHAPTDTPDTLNYDAMADVTRMIVAHILLTLGNHESGQNQ